MPVAGEKGVDKQVKESSKTSSRRYKCHRSSETSKGWVDEPGIIHVNKMYSKVEIYVMTIIGGFGERD